MKITVINPEKRKETYGTYSAERVDDGRTLIKCVFCGHSFFLGNAPGAAGVAPDGTFRGACPECGCRNNDGCDGADGCVSEQDLDNLVAALELTNGSIRRLCRKLWEKGYIPFGSWEDNTALQGAEECQK